MFTHRLALVVALLALCGISPAHTSEASPPSDPPPPESAPEPARLTLAGVRVIDAGNHPDAGITPQSIQSVADRALREVAGAQGLPASLTFQQLEQIAAQVTLAYRQAGFLVAKAILPPQTIGQDRVLVVQVVEGRLGKISVQGGQRYRDDTLAASSLDLVGRPLRQQDLQSALLYARDLPGVSVTSVLQPGENPGETDVILVAEESARPYAVSLGLNNHGTDSTGRYRAGVGINAYNALGAGDVLSANVAYGLDPNDSWQGAFSLSIPSAKINGLSLITGLSRSEMELNSGPFAALDIHGPTTLGYAGLDWKFVNRTNLQMQASTRWIHQQSRLDGLGIQLSNHKFDVLEAGFTLRHTDQRLRGINLLQFSARKSINDESAALDWLYPAHDSYYWVARLALARLQTLPAHQRLLLRASGQFTNSALTPMEQFSIGGPTSVRALPLSAAMGDRGVQATLEYQVDAPGFAARPSPFQGRNWGDVLSFQIFYDWGRVSPVQANRQLGIMPTTLDGAGISLGLRLPYQQGLNFDVSASTPTRRTPLSEGDDVRVWASIGLTF